MSMRQINCTFMRKLSFSSILVVILAGCCSANLPASATGSSNIFTCLGPVDDSAITLQRGDDAKDRSVPLPVELKWKATSEKPEDLTFNIYLAQKDNFTDADIICTNTHAMCVAAVNLEIGAVYSWQVAAKRNGEIVAQSPVWKFRTPADTPRWIEVDGVTNVRDMGGWATRDGYKVKQELLYRGGALNAIKPRGRDAFVKSLKIKTDIDLRADGKAAMDPAEVNWIKTGVGPYTAIMQRTPIGRDGYRKVFHELAKPENYPVYFHCQAGADRAGTVAFLVGAILDERFDDLIRDYELTSRSLSGKRDHNSASFSAFLKTLDAFGEKGDSLQFKVYRYLLEVGVTEKEIASICRILTGHEFKPHKAAEAGYEIILPVGGTTLKL